MTALFKPLLAGATVRDRAIACLAAAIGIAGMAIACALLPTSTAPLIVAPMGASAVLIFAVPASPLAQPWPVIGGNVISALVGITAAKLVPDTALAAGVAVGAAILIMSLLRCLHPPGGAAALTAVIGGQHVAAAGYLFALLPVGINAVLLAATGWLFHRRSGHSYPHRPAVQSSAAEYTPKPHLDDVDRALEDLGDTFDISREDLALLVARVTHHARARTGRR